MATALKQFAALSTRTYKALTDLTGEFAAGAIDADTWGDAFHALLVQSHGDSWALGMRLGGGQVADDLAGQYGQAAADTELEWLQSFINDLDDGRYLDDEGNLRVSQVNSRARLYASKLRATANQGFLEAAPDDDYEWRMTALEHCEDCPRLAALSPYKAHELFTVPGAGDTECLGNCKCIIIRLSDGVKGFPNAF